MVKTGGHGGFSATEVMVAALVAAVLAIPTLGLLFQSRDAEQRSRFEYLALLAARDEMYQSRVLVALGRKPEEVAHGFRSLTGSALEQLAPVFAGTPEKIDYLSEQERVATSITFEAANPVARRLRVGTLVARWMDPAAVGGPGSKSRRTQMELVFGVVAPPKP